MNKATRAEDDDVVDDSEPERERIRAEKEYGRKEKSAMPKPEIIVLSDDDDSVPSSPVLNVPDPVKYPRSSQPHGESIENDLRPTNGILISTATSENEESEDRLQLGHFAFRSESRISGLSRSQSAPRVPPAEKVVETTVTQKGGRAPRHRFGADFSDAELDKVTKCVSCDISWTRRKTAIQKMTHVQTCARKNALTDETILILLRREIDNAPIYTTVNGKGSLAPIPSEPPRTFLENVVNDTAPKAKGKRLKILSTVQSVSETRDAILDKAQAILGNHSTADEEFDTVPPTQVFGRSKFTSLAAVRLAELSTRNSTVVSPNDSPPHHSDDEIGGQIFGPSKLRESYRRPAKSDTVPTPGEFQNPLREHVLLPLAPFTDLTTSSVRDRHLRCLPDTSNETSVEILSDTQSRPPCAFDDTSKRGSGDYDRAQNVYEPCGQFTRNNNGFSLETGEDTQDYSQRNFLPNHEEAMKQPDGSKNAILAHATASKSWNLSIEQVDKGTEKRRSKEVESGDEWESRVRDKILGDEALHLRILRYEPIKFEVILEVINEPPTRGLMVKLRPLLDKLGVNFHGEVKV